MAYPDAWVVCRVGGKAGLALGEDQRRVQEFRSRRSINERYGERRAYCDRFVAYLLSGTAFENK